MRAGGVLPARSFELIRQGRSLPVSATVGAASAVEAAATVEATATATVEAASAMEATCVASTRVAAAEAATYAATSKAAASAVEAASAVQAASSIEPASAVIPVEPRAGADKDATGKPARTVVAVRSTRVRVISIVAIVAHGGRANVARADSNADHNPLRMCERHRNQASAKYSQNS